MRDLYSEEARIFVLTKSSRAHEIVTALCDKDHQQDARIKELDEENKLFIQILKEIEDTANCSNTDLYCEIIRDLCRQALAESEESDGV